MRTLVACIVALSIPLQGLASTLMPHCASERGHATYAAPPVPSAARSHNAHAAAERGGQHAATAAPNHIAAAPDVHPDAAAGDETSSADRPACAVCCAALITQAPLVTALDAHTAHPAAVAPPASPERNAGGIERPPRFAAR
jgi:hypothetical protein